MLVATVAVPLSGGAAPRGEGAGDSAADAVAMDDRVRAGGGGAKRTGTGAGNGAVAGTLSSPPSCRVAQPSSSQHAPLAVDDEPLADGTDGDDVRRGVAAAATSEGAQTLLAGREALLTVCCTHLDHIDEEQRLVQVSHALGELRETHQGTPHLLAGDLNALHGGDYSPAEWAEVESKAAANGWVAPVDASCLRLLIDNGYVDAFRAACGASHVGEIPPGVAKFTAHAERPMYRIDYVFLSPSAVDAGLHPVGAYVDTSAMGSDHFPLVVDLAWGSGTAEVGSRPSRL